MLITIPKPIMVANIEEPPYDIIGSGDPTIGTKKPDFYLPDYNIYYEHWALDEKGFPTIIPEFLCK